VASGETPDWPELTHGRMRYDGKHFKNKNMKKVIYITACTIFVAFQLVLFTPSCTKEHVSAQRDIKCTVVGFGKMMRLQHSSKMILFRSCRDTTMFVEMAIDDEYNGFTIEDYYNWNIGDTVSFDNIRQDQFFRIYNQFTHM
jgi:hypothetical protein